MEESGKGLSRPLNRWGWGNSHVAMDVVIMYSESLVGGESLHVSTCHYRHNLLLVFDSSAMSICSSLQLRFYSELCNLITDTTLILLSYAPR